jgi:two-component system phosphate regulon sensor histidine kinase PhoR
MSVILTDLRSLKATQEELRQKNEELEAANLYASDLNADLENKVRARTRDLMISQGNLKFLSDKIPVIVWTALPNGSIDYFNQRWFDFTGLEFEDSKGNGWQKMLHPEDRKKIISIWQHAISNAENFEIEYRCKGADNQYRWFLGKAVPFKDEEENLIAWFGTSTDIEDQKKAIEKKDEFIGIASHELKTPLTSLTGYLQLIESYKK